MLQDTRRILNFLPHRYPFLLVDRIIEMEEETIKAIKNVTFNEPFFQGHFPENPVMPGVLIVEALAQAGGLLLLDKYSEQFTKDNSVMFLGGVEKARFKKPVLPGDTLDLEVKLVFFRRGVAKIEGTAKVKGEIVASATILSAVKTKEELGIK